MVFGAIEVEQIAIASNKVPRIRKGLSRFSSCECRLSNRVYHWWSV